MNFWAGMVTLRTPEVRGSIPILNISLPIEIWKRRKEMNGTSSRNVLSEPEKGHVCLMLDKILQCRLKVREARCVHADALIRKSSVRPQPLKDAETIKNVKELP